MKILKKKAENENKYAVGKLLRTGRWAPATVTDVTDGDEVAEDMEVEGEDVHVEDVDAEFMQMKSAIIEPVKKMQVACMPPVQQQKFMDYLKEKSTTENLLEEIMDQCVSVWL